MAGIQRNIDAQFLATIPNVQAGSAMERLRVAFDHVADAFERFRYAGQQVELMQTIERRCAGHVRRQARVRR